MFYVNLIKYLPDMPSWHIVAVAFAAYVVYYFIRAVKRPIMACDNGPFKELLLKKLPALEKNFWPTFWCIESRAQTVFASLLRSQMIPALNYRREVLSLRDGGQVALDWSVDGCANNAPCVLILPGLTGQSQAKYIKCLVGAINKSGLRVVVFNNRGFGGIELKTPLLYCASKCDDLIEVVRHVKQAISPCKLGAVGVSVGGLILGNYLAHESKEAHHNLTAAKIISVPWDVHKGTASIEKPYLNPLLGRHLVNSLCRTLSSNCDIFKKTDLDMKRILSCKTLKEFDAHFTSKQFGYAHVDDYYTDATLHSKLEYISVPLLCLNAADDPFQPFDGIPMQEAAKCSHVAIVVTARGGHIGFLEGWWPPAKDQTYMGRLVADFFIMALYDEDGEFAITANALDEIYAAKQSSISSIEREERINSDLRRLRTESLVEKLKEL